jgi:septum formation protein
MNKSFIPKQHIILASKSPRRQQLLKELGWEFTILTKDIDESFPDDLKREHVALYLCEHKAKAFNDVLSDDTIVITADTIVCLDDLIINKPEDANDAHRMLRLLSGRQHDVYTGVCISSPDKTKSFFVKSSVFFKELSNEEIDYYITVYRPFDKAGAYGIQEWIGFIGIEKIEGSYFNVMGLPVKEVYEAVLSF